MSTNLHICENNRIVQPYLLPNPYMESKDKNGSLLSLHCPFLKHKVPLNKPLNLQLCQCPTEEEMLNWTDSSKWPLVKNCGYTVQLLGVNMCYCMNMKLLLEKTMVLG